MQSQSKLFFIGLMIATSVHAITVNDRVMIDVLLQHRTVDAPVVQELYDASTDRTFDEYAVVDLLTYDRPLFEKFAGLCLTLPHVTVGDLPTPIEKFEQLGQDIGCAQLYIKRDDMTGTLSEEMGRLFGGNKVRKLEFLLAEPLCTGAKTVMTIGGAGSNHALATTVCSQMLGLSSVSILGPQENNPVVERNLRLGVLHDAQLHYFDEWAQCTDGIVELFKQCKQHDGVYPYYITVGVSSPVGVVGFVNAAFELKEQIEQGGYA